MKGWARASVDTICGGPCSGTIPAGKPMLVFRLDNVKGANRQKLRCERCADEPVPSEIPATMATVAAARPSLSFARFASGLLPLDFRSAMAGEREPGCDDV